MYVCMYVCVYVCMYVYIYVCMYLRMYVCMYACMYVEKEKEPVFSQIEEEERISMSGRIIKNNKGNYELDTMI